MGGIKSNMYQAQYNCEETLSSTTITTTMLPQKPARQTEHWFDTGDVGFLDLKGNLRVVGRSKEIIIINGNNYSSFELEYAIESSGVSGITPSYLTTFSSWDDSHDSEGVVILFNPDEKANSISTILKTIDDINKAIHGFCEK